MEAHRIAVISDTHGVMRQEVEAQLQTCEIILHGGDMDNPELLKRLEQIRKVYAVKGNADGDWAEGLPEELETELYGFRIYMIHNRKKSGRDLSQFDIVISGHSHRYHEERSGRTLYLNPGSCGRRRFRLPLTMMILILYPQEHRTEVRRIDCSAEPEPAAGDNRLSEQDMYRLVKSVMREVDAGRTICGIAARYHVSEELAEQICRMYVTHPGVDADGIMDRMERRNL